MGASGLRMRTQSPYCLRVTQKLRATIFLLAAVSTGNSQTYSDGPWIYSVEWTGPSSGAAIISSYQGPGGDVVVPSTLAGAPVVSFGTVFRDNQLITNVIIPQTVTSIAENAFRECRSLRSVKIGAGATSIGPYAFFNCRALENIEIGEGVTSIGSWAFGACMELVSVTIPDSVQSIGARAFSDCLKLANVVIGNGVSSLGEGVFYYCHALTSIILPPSITSIPENAFSWCVSLTDVQMGNGVTSLGASAFYNCRDLVSLNLPNSVTHIGAGAFAICESLAFISIGNSVTTIEAGTFSGCTALQSFNIPDSVAQIGESAFRRTGLKSINIPTSVTSIGGAAFADCTSLASVRIPDSVQSLGWSVFYGCSGLTSVTIGMNVAQLGADIFRECTQLKSVFFRGNIPSVSGAIFVGIPSVGTVYHVAEASGWGSSFYGWPTRTFSPIDQPFLVVEDPSGSSIESGSRIWSLPPTLLGSSSTSQVFTLRNTGSAVLSNLVVTKAGAHSNDLTLVPPSVNALAPGEAAAFSVTFVPSGGGKRDAQVVIDSTDPERSPFRTEFYGFGLSAVLDSDGDGLSDAAERNLTALGFDWQMSQPELVATLVGNAASANLYTRDQYDDNRLAGRADVISDPASYDLYSSASIMDLRMGGAMVQKHGNSATIVFQPQTTMDLATQPFTNNGTPVTNTIPMPGSKGFLRIQAR
jgi:hypothetical protein